MKKLVAVIYVRVSGYRQKQQGNITRKMDMMKEVVRNYGFDEWSFHTYADQCNKSVPFSKREAMPKLLKLLKSIQDECQVFFFIEKLDRIGTTAMVKDFVHKHVITPDNKLYVVEDGGEVDLNNWDAFVQLVEDKRIEEKDIIRANTTKEGREQLDKHLAFSRIKERIKRDNQIKNQPSYPYRWNEDKHMFVIHDSSWAECVKHDMFNAYAYQHKTDQNIADELNERQEYRTAEDKQWTANTVARILKNWSYVTGVKLTEFDKYKCETFIDEHTFKRVQAIRKYRLRYKGKFTPKYPLKCIVWCKQCTQMMVIDRGYYKCSSCKMKRDVQSTDDSIISIVKQQIRDRLYDSGRYDVVEKQGVISLRIYGMVSDVNWYTVVKNWVDRVWVLSDSIVVEGMTYEQLDELMC